LFEYDLTAFQLEAEKEKAKLEKQRAKELADANVSHPEWKAQWQAYNEREWTNEKGLSDKIRGLISMIEYGESGNNISLRTDGEYVETTKGIVLPVAVAKRYWMHYLYLLGKGGCNSTTSCNWKLRGFSAEVVNNERIKVGCHDIPRSEIDFIAKKLEWPFVAVADTTPDDKLI